ncbi:hypothetical protein M378DRAFT_154696 [Amanita muscaria Koide BX008]|uniref:Uncharacterized protein n=1 Tax=Amanita muscaria (strain Koide BX008) TaxID=946122 RepID=A0A0C2TV55_AMAMK|nr:hypothetical protein M378DRAFT_154696 [Amanita muscaria Koide BX008]
MRQWDSCLVAVVWDIPPCFLDMYQLHSVWVAIDDLVTTSNDRACIWCILVNLVFFEIVRTSPRWHPNPYITTATRTAFHKTVI